MLCLRSVLLNLPSKLRYFLSRSLPPVLIYTHRTKLQVARLQDELVAVKDEIQAKVEEILALKEEISKSSDKQASIDRQLASPA